MFGILLAVVLFETPPGGMNGIDFKVETENAVIDPARSTIVKMTMKTPREVKSVMPDLQSRLRGFSRADDNPYDPVTGKDGRTVEVVEWRLVPEPCAEIYRIAPFAVSASPRMLSSRGDEGKYSFVVGPLNFESPAKRESVTGDMKIDLKRDLPPLTWKLVGKISAAVLAVLGVLAVIVYLVKFISRRIREHRMSPIERAWVELDRLIAKGLPGRGRYKDFYVELTMVVRRYVQRKYRIKAPHLTTEEFLAEFQNPNCQLSSNRQLSSTNSRLKEFLESADMVKFAGVEATPEMADAATDSARGYLKSDGEERK